MSAGLMIGEKEQSAGCDRTGGCTGAAVIVRTAVIRGSEVVIEGSKGEKEAVRDHYHDP
jgi:hypothetical protein